MAESTLTAPQPSTTHTDDLTHVVCDCDTNTALCGIDVTNAEWGATTDMFCVVCLEIDGYYETRGLCCRHDEETTTS